MDLPLELLEQYQKGRVLVFIGQGINGPEWTRLGQKLTDRIGEEKASGAQTTEEIMELYESLQNRQALVQFVLDFYRQADGPNKVHNLLARLRNCRFFVTTCIDERFEEAFREAGQLLHRIIHRSDLAYSSAYTARLYRLYGVLSQPESLRLTQEDTADAFSLSEVEGFSDVLKGHLADSTIVFVGYNLDDAFFKQLYRNSIKPLHRHNPRCYAFAERDYTELTRWFCLQNNIEILKASLTDILAAFVKALETQAPWEDYVPEAQIEDLKNDAFRPQPYKRLFSYGPEDSSIFFGRQEETEWLLALVHAHQLVVLCGDSGVGKSSLLGAGLIPMLEAGDYAVVQERVLDSPISLLRQRLSRGLAESPDDESLVSLLRVATQQRPLVIILDQFEEYFTHLDNLQRENFTHELAQALARRDLPVKWVFSLRSDYLARLNELRPAIPNIFKAEFYLTPLRGESAAQAIGGPLAVVGMRIEAELQQRMLTDLEQEGWIEPPQLQIVCHELYQTALAKGDNTLRLEYYSGRGGAREILGSYLEQALRRLPPLQDVHARQVLIALVSGEGLPAVLSLEEVANSARLAVEETAELITRLQEEWLVKTMMHEGQQVYELAHAYLAANLAVESDVLQRKAIEELLRRNLQDWQRYRIMLSEEELSTIRNWVGKIEFSLDAQKLILRSAIQRNKELTYWLGQVAPEIIQPILKEFLVGGEAIEPQPLVAITALGSLAQREPFIEDLCNLLQNPSLPLESSYQVATYLAQMNPSLALKILRDGPNHLHTTNRQVIVELYNAEATGQINLSQPASWAEQRAIVFSRLQTNAGYLLARTGTAGIAASVGGLIGSLAGYSLIQGKYALYLFGAVFVPFVWAIGLALGITLAEILRLNRNLGTLLAGAIIGNLPLVVLAATDTNLEIARLGFIYGLLGALLSGCIMAVALHFSTQIRSGLNAIIAITGAAIAGLAYSLVFRPLVGTTDIPGFNLWSLAGILAGGSVSMMLGLLFVPSEISVGTSSHRR